MELSFAGRVEKTGADYSNARRPLATLRAIGPRRGPGGLLLDGFAGGFPAWIAAFEDHDLVEAGVFQHLGGHAGALAGAAVDHDRLVLQGRQAFHVITHLRVWDQAGAGDV